MSKEIRVGDWTFRPETGGLARDGERRRLEHRAAKVLELLCRRPGSTFSAAELVESVWNGRSLSPNSVAVVIADLRRALDDDSRNPAYIETIPKRGYRLLAPVSAPDGAEAAPPAAATEPRGRNGSRPLIALLLLLLVGGLAWAGWTAWGPRAGFAVALGDFPNRTGSSAHDPLVPAITELVATELGRLPNVRLLRSETGIDARLRGTIILWDGHPAVALFAEDPGSGAVLWSGMASAPPPRLPGRVRSEIARFGAFVESGDGGAR